LPKTSCGKNAAAAENGHIFQLLSIFHRSVTHSRVARAAHQPVKYQGKSLLCACGQFQHSSLHFYESIVNLQNRENQGCSLTFF
jgi:hypothetical protein